MRTRVRARVGAVAMLTMGLVTPLLGGPAVAAGGDWKDTVAALAEAPYEVNAIAYKERVGLTLPADSTDDLGDRRVAAVLADAGSKYVDGARFLSEDAGRAAYESDLHLASWLSSRLSSGASTAEVAAVSDLLLAGRLAADAAIQDAEAALRVPEASEPTVTVDEAEEPDRIADVESGQDLLAAADATQDDAGRDAALRELDQARRAFAKAEAALEKSLPVASMMHMGLAWRHGYNALGHLGITYDGDRDGDGVMDRVEMMLGSSPLRIDSDGDGLTDRFEIDALFSHSMPADPDTDGDGVPDGAEDLDGDTLTALQEQRAGSSPTEPDTDRDRSDDAAEVRAGTDPTDTDSDDDGLVDGVEPATGTDPLDADSDDDGVLDGEEVLSQQAEGIDGISATLVGRGDLVSSFRVHEVTTDQRLVGAGGQVGPAYDFSISPPAAARLQQAELTLPYDPSTLGDTDPQDLRLFYFDPEHGVWEPAADGQVVDTEAHVVRATVTHFSTYAIFDIRNWDETWEAQDNPCRSRSDGGSDIVLLDLALVLDSSGSMAWNDPLGLRRTAAKNFVDALLPEDRAGVVDFDSWAYVAQGLTTDHTAVKSAIDRIDDWGGTNIAAGVRLGNNLLINNGDPARARMAILLTDGEGYYDPALTQQAKTYGITIYTIGLGANVDQALLQNIATQTGGKYHQVSTADELPEVFRRISEDTGGDPRAAEDTDEDGLNDCVEIEGALGPDLQRYTSDPTVKDTDGDGLDDAEEVGKPTSGEGMEGWFDIFAPAFPEGTVVYDVFADPWKSDTDGDDLDDPNEADLETRARDTDTDGDDLSDGLEVETVGSAPDVYDTDGDDLGDGYEHAHRDDQGLSPLFYDEQVSTWSYSTDFAKGAILGDLWREDSLAWLAGNLASGASSFIPVYGWIVGGVADLRDAVGSAIHADWVGSGLSVVGVLPYAGDAVAIPGKAAKFVLRNPELADEALSFIAKLDDVPSSIKTRAAKEILGSSWDVLVNARFSEAALETLQKGRTNLDELADAISSSRHVAGAAATFFAKGSDGEKWLESLYGATAKGKDKQVWRSTKGFIGRGRYFDVFVNGVAHESKVGFVKWSKSIENQILKDAHLAATDDTLEGVHWHFFASSASNTMGADKRVLDLLDQKGIPYTLHVPGP
jgi:hypothetical protein